MGLLGVQETFVYETTVSVFEKILALKRLFHEIKYGYQSVKMQSCLGIVSGYLGGLFFGIYNVGKLRKYCPFTWFFSRNS